MIQASGWRAALLSLFLGSGLVAAQTPPPADTKAAAANASEPSPDLGQLAWLEGCWRGSVNQREFREHWLPLRGNLLVGASQTVMNDKTLDYEYMRIEPRADGIYYVAAAQQRELAYRLTGVESDEGDTVFTFANPALEFPQKIIYRRSASEGWLYATVEGKAKGADRKVIYPMRRIDCESGDPLRK